MNEEERLAAMALVGGLLGRPRYPVLGLGTPSGLSYPNAQDAAQGWAGQLGFNIDPRGGLLLRPWEAQSWQLSGIDPNLWNAPFAGGGLLGGGYPGGGFTQPGFSNMGFPPGWTWTPDQGWVRDGDTTTDTTTTDTTTTDTTDTTDTTTTDTTTTDTDYPSISVFWDYNPNDPTQWHPPLGFDINPHDPRPPFMQWTQFEHNRRQGGKRETDVTQIDEFGFNPFMGPTRDWQSPTPVVPQITVPAPAPVVTAPSVDNFSSYVSQVQPPPSRDTGSGTQEQADRVLETFVSPTPVAPAPNPFVEPAIPITTTVAPPAVAPVIHNPFIEPAIPATGLLNTGYAGTPPWANKGSPHLAWT